MNFLLELTDPWAYVVIFLLAAAEGAALIGLFLPGETAMLLAGVLVYQGRATLTVMLLAGCLGAVIGDSIGYWIGRRFGATLRGSRLGRRVGEQRWSRAGAYLRERGARAVFFGRFLGFLRTLVPPIAGSTRMPYARFVVFNAPAAILWSALFIVVGVAAGRSWHAVDAWAGRASVILLVVVGFGLAIVLAARWVQHREHLLHDRWHSLLDDERVKKLRTRFAPQIEFVRRRLDPNGRFGLYLSAGLAVALVAAAGFGAVLDSLAEHGDVAEFDASVLEFFSEHRVPRLDGPMDIIAGAGNVVWIAGTISLMGGMAYLVSRRWGWIVFATLVLAGAVLLDDVVVWLLDVLRVTPVAISQTGPRSFPSSEATAGGAFVGQVAYVVSRTRSWRAAVWATAAALFAAIVVATASIYAVGQMPSAMLGGFLLGLFWAAVSATSSDQLSHLWKASR